MFIRILENAHKFAPDNLMPLKWIEKIPISYNCIPFSPEQRNSLQQSQRNKSKFSHFILIHTQCWFYKKIKIREFYLPWEYKIKILLDDRYIIEIIKKFEMTVEIAQQENISKENKNE